MDTSLRNLFLVLAVVALIWAGSVSAQALPTPMQIVPVSPTPAGLQTAVTFDARGVAGAANAGYYTRPVLVSNNTLAGLGRGLLRRSVPVAAMLAAIEAAGWAIDELSGQVVTNPPPPFTEGQGVRCFQHPETGVNRCMATHQAFRGTSISFSWGSHTVTGSSNTYLQLDNGAVGGISLFFVAWPANDHLFVPHDWPSPQPVSDAALAEVVKADPALANEALRNPDGSVNRNPDVMAGAQALADEIAAAAENPQQDWDQGNQSGPDPMPSGQAGEWPGFCAWATKVCDAIDWLRDDDLEDDDAELPITEVPVTPSTWTSGLGNGACPADRAFALSMGSFSMSYAPVCQVADFVRPLVILSAMLIAAYIVAGVGRGSNA